MNRIIAVALATALVLAIPLVAFSEQQVVQQQTIMPQRGMMMEKAKEMKPMHEMTMKKMMDKEIVATSDGGVVVMVGNKLLKYDRNLNLKAEAEINIDYKAMKEKWMKKDCPASKQMMEEKAAE